jgi:hypothetical protein
VPTTVALHDDLVGLAQEYTGVAEKTALIREALNALIERESARRLASLGRHNAGIEEPSTPEDEAISGARPLVRCGKRYWNVMVNAK